MAVPLPPVQTAYQFLDLKAESGHIQCSLRRGIAADPIAVGDDEAAWGDLRGGFRRHAAVWDIDGSRNVFVSIRLGRAGIDEGEGLARLDHHAQIPRVRLVLQFVGIVRDLFLVYGQALVLPLAHTYRNWLFCLR